LRLDLGDVVGAETEGGAQIDDDQCLLGAAAPAANGGLGHAVAAGEDVDRL